MKSPFLFRGLDTIGPSTEGGTSINIQMHQVLVELWSALDNGHSRRQRRPLTDKTVIFDGQKTTRPRRTNAAMGRAIIEIGRRLRS